MATQKTRKGQRSKRGRKDPSPVLLCDMLPSPARPTGLVSLLALQTLGIFAKHKGHNCLPSTSFLPGTEIWSLPKGQRRLKVQRLSEALLFDFFWERSALLGANRAASLHRHQIGISRDFHMPHLKCSAASSESNVNEGKCVLSNKKKKEERKREREKVPRLF